MGADAATALATWIALKTASALAEATMPTKASSVTRARQSCGKAFASCAGMWITE